MTLNELIPVLQVAVGPVILISGIGLLLLSMTNRFGRIIDRSRILAGVLHDADGVDRQRAIAQLRILMHRATLVRRAIILAAVSLLFAAVLIISLFIATALGAEVAWLVAALFIACLCCLIVSLIFFIIDVNQSLGALRLEVRHELHRESVESNDNKPGTHGVN